MRFMCNMVYNTASIQDNTRLIPADETFVDGPLPSSFKPALLFLLHFCQSFIPVFYLELIHLVPFFIPLSLHFSLLFHVIYR